MGLLQEASAENGSEKSRLQKIMDSAQPALTQDELLSAIEAELNPEGKKVEVETVRVDSETFENVQEVILESEQTPASEFDIPESVSSPSRPDSGNTVFGELIPLDDGTHPAVKGHGWLQNTHNGMLMAKSMLTQLIRTSPETRAALEAVIQERAESAYLEAASRNDRFKLEAFARQMGDINQALSRLEGKPTSVLAKYVSNPDNAPISTGEGLIAFRNFYISTAEQILPMFEIAGEKADIRGQLELIPARNELALAKMDAQSERAQKYIEIADDIIEERRLKGKALGEGIQSILVPILTSPAIAVTSVPLEIGKWVGHQIDDAKDKMEPISAVAGASGTVYLILATGLMSNPLIAVPLGLVLGPAIGLATYKGVKLGSAALSEKVSTWWKEQQAAMAEKKKQKDAAKAAKDVQKQLNSANSSPLVSGSSKK